MVLLVLTLMRCFCVSNVCILASSSVTDGTNDSIDTIKQSDDDDNFDSRSRIDDTNVDVGVGKRIRDISIEDAKFNTIKIESSIEDNNNNDSQDSNFLSTLNSEIIYDEDNEDEVGQIDDDKEQFVSSLRQARFHTVTPQSSSSPYGTDVSWPMQRSILPEHQTNVDDSHWTTDSTTSATIDETPIGMTPEQLERYIAYMEGCYTFFGLNINKCNDLELERIHRNFFQPQYQLNYTKDGYVKMKLPNNLYEPIYNVWVNDYYSDNIMDSERLNNTAEFFWHNEYDEPTSVLTNRWVSPTHFLPLTSIPNSPFNDDDEEQQQSPSVHQQQLSMKLPSILQYVQSAMEEWMTNEYKISTTSSSLLSTPVLQLVSTSSVPTSAMGMRMYSKGSIVAPHVNRYDEYTYLTFLTLRSPVTHFIRCSSVNHLFRLPFVCTAIINIAQDAKGESWPYELINHDGNAVNVTLEPGEMLFYESQSIIHGRPYPYHGEYYTNFYLNFEPIDYSFKQQYHMMRVKQQQLQQRNRRNEEISIEDTKVETTAAAADTARGSKRKLFHDAFQKYATTDSKPISSSSSTKAATATATLPTTQSESTTNKQSATNRLWQKVPPYIKTLIEHERWNQQYVFYRDEKNGFDTAFAEKPEVKKFVLKKLNTDDEGEGRAGSSSSGGGTPGMTKAQIVAANGELTKLKDIAKKNPKSLNVADSNGWKPIHEGARGGHVDVVKFLLKTIPNCDINERTNNGSGGSPLWFAEAELSKNHPMIQFLRKNGAVAIAPDDLSGPSKSSNDDEDDNNDGSSKNLKEER
jgi:hypothetical protein